MSRSGILYALYCAAVVLIFAAASGTGSSPFADGGARPFHSAFYGPTHK